jgi:ABC-type amino acid transport substrate-binding protein
MMKGSPFFSLRNNRTISGFLGLLLIELSREMNFTIKMLQPMKSYGNWNRQENTWTGVISQLMADKADIGASEFSLMSDRLNVVDFTLPLIHSRSRLYFRQPDSADLHWSGYFQVRIIFLNLYSNIILIMINYDYRDIGK